MFFEPRPLKRTFKATESDSKRSRVDVASEEEAGEMTSSATTLPQEHAATRVLDAVPTTGVDPLVGSIAAEATI